MLNQEKHRELMSNILIDIFESDINNAFAFKWWTCCYFLYWLDRFSTDLDFDLINQAKNLDENLIQILNKYWKIKLWQKRLILSYWEREHNIKIDINRNIWNENIYKTVNFFGTDIKVQDKSSIFANKLIASINRNTNRDIYDIYFFMKNMWNINEKIIFEKTKKNSINIFEELLKKLEKLPKNYKILDWLWEILTNEQKVFTKDKLISKLIGLLEQKISFSKKNN